MAKVGHEIVGPSINPAILGIRDAASKPGLEQHLVGGKPAGYLSPGDWVVLRRGSFPYNGYPVHNRNECPHEH